MEPYPSVVVPAFRPALLQFASARALSHSSCCSARKTAVVSPLPCSTPLVAYWNPVVIPTRPIASTSTATSTSPRLKPRWSRIERLIGR
jgi:hypothetical protein